MEKRSMCTHSNHSGLSSKDLNSNERSKMYNLVNSAVNTGQNQVSDLQKLSSRIICSANITRQNLNQEQSLSIVSDDEDEFLKKLKYEIDTDLCSRSKENYKPNDNRRIVSLSRKKKPIIDEESLNVIKRFKMDTNHKTFMQTLSNINTMQSTCIASNVTEEMCNKSTNTVSKNVLGQKNLFTSNTLNTNFRSPSNKYVFQMSSKIQKNNVLPLCMNETNFIRMEYEEFLFCAFLTPPDSNSNDI